MYQRLFSVRGFMHHFTRNTLIMAGGLLLCSGIASAAEFKFNGFKKSSDPEVYQVSKKTNGTINAEVVTTRKYQPGIYSMKLPYQAKGDFNAYVMAFINAQKQVSPLQSFPSTRGWSEIFIIFKLDEPSELKIGIRKAPKEKIDQIEVKAPTITNISLDNANWFPEDGYITGNSGGFPVGWTHYKQMDSTQNGLTDDSGYEKSSLVLKFGSTANAGAFLQSVQFPFPDKGKNMEFSIWAKAPEGQATIKMYLLGDAYKWSTSKRFSLSGKWKKYTIRRALPDKVQKSPYFWCRLDLDKNSKALIGRVELKQTDASLKTLTSENETNTALSKNLVINPDFSFGYWGWDQWNGGGANQPYDKLKNLLNRQDPLLVNGGVNGGTAIKVEPMTYFTSFCMPISKGKTYTVSAYMKNAVSGKKSSCKLFLLDSNWKKEDKNFALTDEWQRYSFTFKWNNFSRRGVAYLRFDPKDNPILIDRVQLEEGKLSDFTTQPVEIGLKLKPENKYNIFSNTDTSASMLLTANCRPDIKGTITLTAISKDAWGKQVFVREFKTDASPRIQLELPVNKTGLRGVFNVETTAKDASGKLLGSGLFRYAVCSDLSGKELPDNPVAGHFQMISPLNQTKDLMQVLERYFPINTFNRCFFKNKYLDNPDVATLCKSAIDQWTWPKSVKRIVCIGLPDRNIDWVKQLLAEDEVAPEVLKKYLEYVNQTTTSLNGVIDGLELLNEPFLWRVKSGPLKGKATMGPEKTACLYKAAYPVIKKISPNIMVVGQCGGLRHVEWYESFFKAGGAKYIDAFTFHGYCDSPDLSNMYGAIMDMRKALAKYGRPNIPVWNGEQYFGSRSEIQRQHEGEYYRHYFKDKEIDTASVVASNLIHHAAADSRWSMFGFAGEILHGSRDELLINYTFGVCNAIAELLGNAGTGYPLELGAALKCFIFPKAKGGVLATLNTIDAESTGKLELPENVTATDMMGNKLKEKTIDLQHSPVFLSFPAEISQQKAEEQLRNAKIFGLGAPFDISIAMTAKDNLAVTILNRLNRQASGSVVLDKAPASWTFEDTTQKFQGIAPGQTAILNFKLNNAKIIPLKNYQIKFKLATDSERFTKTAELSAIFATHLPEINGNGNLKAWDNASWIELGADNTSKVYNRIKWSGPNDLKAKIAYGWNDKGLGLALIVDDNVFSWTDSERHCYDHDSLQLYFDMKNDATPETAAKKTATSDDVSYQVGWVNGKTPVAYLDHAPAGRYIGEANKQQGIDSDVTVTCRKLSNHRVLYDIFFPKVTLPDVKFQGGISLGVSLLLNDNDGKGRKTGLTLAPKGKEPFQAPHEYRDLILLPSK